MYDVNEMCWIIIGADCPYDIRASKMYVVFRHKTINQNTDVRQ